MRKQWKPKKWDKVLVSWIDTTGNAVAPASEGSVTCRVTPGHFYEIKTQKFVNADNPRDVRKVKVLVIADTKDEEEVAPMSGWTTMPLDNVFEITELVTTKKRWKP